MKYLAPLLMAVLPLPACAADLVCVPDTVCIDADCQKGHDDKAEVQLRNWTSAKPVLHSAYGNVPTTGRKGTDLLQWSGRNTDNQIETLSLRPSDMHFTYVIALEPGSVVEKLTSKGHCAVTE